LAQAGVSQLVKEPLKVVVVLVVIVLVDYSSPYNIAVTVLMFYKHPML